MKRRNLYLFDGLKAVPIDPDAEGYDWAWRTIGGDAATRSGEMTARAAWQTIGHVRRGLNLRANAVASCPRHYYRPNGEEVQEADIPFLGGFQRTLELIELSLSTSAAFYLYRVTVGQRLMGLRWLRSGSITPKVKDNTLTFERTVNGVANPAYTPEQIVYGWEADPFREIGAGASVLDTVLINAGVVGGINAHAKAFFDRGAINPQLLQLESVTSPDDIDRFKTWWKQVVAGVRNAFASEVLRVKVNKIDLSAPAKDLGMPELGKVQKEDIATGLGIPYSLLFSDAANYATAQQDEQNFWNLTIKPQLDLIAGELNEQVFAPAGLELYFAPEELTIFQEDEAKRATSLSALVSAGMPMDVAMETLGYDPDPIDEARIRLASLLKEGLGYDAARAVIEMDEELAGNEQVQQVLDLFRPAAPESPKVSITGPSMPNMGLPMPADATQQPITTTATDATAWYDMTSGKLVSMPQPAPGKGIATAATEDLAKWQRKSLKRLAANGRAECDFESDVLPASLVGAIKGALSAVEDDASVRRVFASIAFGPYFWSAQTGWES